MESEPQHLAGTQGLCFEPLRGDHRVETFSCGVNSLDQFLRKYALNHPRQGLSRTWVAVTGNRVVGYYTLGIASYTATERIAKGMPAHDIPMILLARLAIDTGSQRDGLGRLALENALRRALAMAEAAANPQSTTLPFRGILVHALNDRAAAFYERYGLQRSPADPLHLMLSMKDLTKSLRQNT